MGRSMAFQGFTERVSTALGATIILLITWILVLFTAAVLVRFGGIVIFLVLVGTGIFLSIKIITFARATPSEISGTQGNPHSALFKDEKNRNALGFLLAGIMLVAIFAGIFGQINEIIFISLFFIAIVGYLVWFCFRVKNWSLSSSGKDKMQA